MSIWSFEFLLQIFYFHPLPTFLLVIGGEGHGRAEVDLADAVASEEMQSK